MKAGCRSPEIYRKPTHSSRYLQFSSHHSDNAKSSVARALFERVSYVTGEEKRKRESGTIEEELKLNNFPHEIIIRERRKAIKKQRERAEGRTASERTTGELETRKKVTISIPYIQGISEAIRRVLGQLGIRTAMRSSNIKWSIMKGVKDKQNYYYYYSLLHHTSQKKAITKGEGEKPGWECACVCACAWVCVCVCARVRTHMSGYIYMQGRVYNCSEAIP